MLKNCILISAVANKGLATATNVAGCLSNLAISRKIHAPSSSRSNELKSANHEQSEKLPDFSKVVICGGGVLGASVAYHLAELGWGKHTVVLEQGRLGGGMTYHSSGLVGVFKPSRAQVRLCKESVQLYSSLSAQGVNLGWTQCGSLNVARTRDRMTHFRRMKAASVALGIECELVTPEQAQKLCPIIQVDDLKGGLWIPGDGVCNPYEMCISLLELAKQKGVQVYEFCGVDKVLTEGDRVSGVETNLGVMGCDTFVNCGGFWARHIGQMSDPVVKVPLHPVEHYYLHTKPIEGLDPSTPVMRDLDGQVYLRQHDGCLLAGGFEPIAKPAYEDGSVPYSMVERVLPEDWDHFHVLLEQLLHRVPRLGSAVLHKLTNGPEAFSPDCKWIIGEAPELRNYHVVAGMKTVGISAAGGVGRATAERIITGLFPYDMYELDICRFLGLHNNRKFLRDRSREAPGLHYALHYPFREFRTGRNLRMSPIYPRLREAGAVFGQVMGYERPTYFDPDYVEEGMTKEGQRPYRIAETNTFAKPDWFDFVAREYEACRETVGLCDYSSFTKIDLSSKGREVVDLLQYLCSNDVDVPVGSIIHTGLQNNRGGYENDCSLTRLSENHYMMIAPTIQQTRCKTWIERHLPSDSSVSLSDVTSMFTAIAIIGPFTRTMLSELTDTDLSPKSFPFFTYKELDVGLANGIRTMNITHTGELGYVLYIPNEFALHVYNKLLEVGSKYNIQHAGHYATRALRIEKFYAYWGQDLDTTTTPLECGRSWRVKFDKGEFIGRDALLRQREEGVKRMYVQLLLQDHDPDIELWAWGGEPIFRDNKYVGATTTTGYGFTLKRMVCLGFVQNFDGKGDTQVVTNEYVLSGSYEVDIGGIRYPAKVNLHSPNLPTKYPDQEREGYFATRDKMVTEPILRANITK
ncbi:pyruvate dehydrogenase phosphatase regulatory subunit, mitochondrial isoform X2 [Macrosteles quadrilineatus]|uniref:pyruvate dehydrogenase phosphatase regulatory subunit, mitochondrial isoform X2 n=1 Tax=Macrosteles quadrilineatus TaxID=74068 RepID=UPI0023E137B0|nr:pyruvate dehydrogenase phosphatase regulatory subunit, mitochondrial isoform X2 [Macrosteles quadrilineatus]